MNRSFLFYYTPGAKTGLAISQLLGASLSVSSVE
jgi:hypothetical protein